MRSFRRVRAAITPLALAIAFSMARPAESAAQFTVSGVAAGETVGGISCDAQEGQRIHIHQHLLIFDHGKLVGIPGNVGQPAAKRCIYWLHTHTPDGIIHIEAPKDRSFTLGDFFLVWAQPLTKTSAASAQTAKGESLKVWVDGKPFKGDPRTIPLVAHADIVIQVGPPFITPPKFTTWGTL